MFCKHNIRKKYLVNPKAQLRIVVQMGFVFLAGFMGALVFVWFYYRRINIILYGSEFPPVGASIQLWLEGRALVIELGIWFFIMSLAFFFVGIRSTNKIVGPIYRIEKTLTALAKGEKIGPITIREKDDFQSLAKLLNQVLKIEKKDEKQGS